MSAATTNHSGSSGPAVLDDQAELPQRDPGAMLAEAETPGTAPA